MVLAGRLASEGGLVVAFRLDGIEVQIGYNDLATLHREIDQAARRRTTPTRLSTSSPKDC